MSTAASKIQWKMWRFLEATLKDFQPNLVIAVDRKGTALLRTFIESNYNSKDKPLGWSSVLCDSAARLVNDDYFDDKPRILVFDDTIRKARTVKRLLENLEARGISRESGRLKLAVFAAHRNCPDKFRPDYCYYPQAADEIYDEIREAIVAYLQFRGSLLLDTEHIEIPIRVLCPRREFFSVLRNAGDTVEFLTSQNRTTVTVHNPRLIDETSFSNRFPESVTTESVVRKCRVIERREGYFAVIPLFYPNVPTRLTSRELKLIPRYGVPDLDSPDINFYLVGLSASLEVVRGMFSVLNPIRDRLEIPRQLPNDYDDPLSHLRSVYPDIDIEEVHKQVSAAIQDGLSMKSEQRMRKSRSSKDEPKSYIIGKDYEFEKIIMPVILRIWHLTKSSYGASGATCAEIMDCAGRLNIPTAVISAALDKVIDEADVVPDIESLPFSDGREYKVRIFRPEGEGITLRIQKYIGLL